MYHFPMRGAVHRRNKLVEELGGESARKRGGTRSWSIHDTSNQGTLVLFGIATTGLDWLPFFLFFLFPRDLCFLDGYFRTQQYPPVVC